MLSLRTWLSSRCLRCQHTYDAVETKTENRTLEKTEDYPMLGFLSILLSAKHSTNQIYLNQNQWPMTLACTHVYQFYQTFSCFDQTALYERCGHLGHHHSGYRTSSQNARSKKTQTTWLYSLHTKVCHLDDRKNIGIATPNIARMTLRKGWVTQKGMSSLQQDGSVS